jgi:hypothetical protein
MKTRAEIINTLFNRYGFQTYLEIGVQNPANTFNKINAKLKHSVDPANLKNTYTHNMTSDDFFQNYVGSQKYDVIFVDGLHTKEQAYIDVKNAIKCLNNNGFIVMHDCNPPTEFIARTYEEFLIDGSGDWTGNVFKAFIRLKQELNNWSCFVVNEDWGCGILTQRNLIKDIVINYDLDNLSWETFNKNRIELLQLISFDEYIKILQ